MHRICLICPYFGTFPNYISLTLRSCRANQSIDWLIPTDCTYRGSLPDNVKMVPVSFDEFRKHVQAAFDFEIALATPYKLCDFRPAYGVILQEYLRDYAFWGHCDVDVIFGDIRHFCPDAILAEYDKVFTRGHLTLYRNTPEVCHYYELTGTTAGYRDVFVTHENRNFDEMRGINTILAERGIRQYSSIGVVGDISALQRKFQLAKPIVNDRLRNYPRQLFIWEKGKTFQVYLKPDGSVARTEVAYIHLRTRRFPDSHCEISGDVDAFFVGPDGFFPKERELQSPDFRTYNKGDWWGRMPYHYRRLPHYCTRCISRMKRLMT